ncbi:hypothetical protein [Sodalis sp. C49]|uniref:hypothetical protein n=1 Tax=unclassified Sodalis (in: enterobacteria) TaxID=2636512 RepID=UPI003965ADC6
MSTITDIYSRNSTGVSDKMSAAATAQQDLEANPTDEALILRANGTKADLSTFVTMLNQAMTQKRDLIMGLLNGAK